MEPDRVIFHDEPKLIVKVATTHQVVVCSDEAERARRKGRRLSCRGDGLLGILIFGNGFELTLGRHEVFIQRILVAKSPKYWVVR